MTDMAYNNLLIFFEYAFYFGCIISGVAAATKVLKNSEAFVDFLTGDIE